MCVFTCVSSGMCCSYTMVHVCRTTLGVGPLLGHYSRQGFLFLTMYSRLAGLLSSRDSLVSASNFAGGALVLDTHTIMACEFW